MDQEITGQYVGSLSAATRKPVARGTFLVDEHGALWVPSPDGGHAPIGANSTGIVVTGGRAVGSTLTAAFVGGTGAVKWVRDGTDISGATALTYVLQTADDTHDVWPLATSFTPAALRGFPTHCGGVVTQPIAISISGTPAGATVGTAYTFTPGTANGSGTKVFSLNSGTLPAGLSLNTGTGAITGTPSGVETDSFTLRVTDTSGFADLATSIVVSAQAGVAPVNTVLPAITGTAQDGQTLTVSNGTWNNTPISYARQWKRAGANISGATGTTYALVTADVGSAITCDVTATNATGSTTATSAATATVIAAALDTRARFFLAPATAYNTGTQGFITGATILTGSANGSAAGNFAITTSAGNFGWLAVLASATPNGIHISEPTDGLGGWSGAGLSGNNTGSSPDPTIVFQAFTDSLGRAWKLFRQDFINSVPSAKTYTVVAA